MKAAIATAVLTAAGIGTGTVRAQEATTAALPAVQPQSDSEHEFGPVAPDEDLAQIQGLWARTEKSGFFSSRRIMKLIEGDKETLTEYDSGGNVASAHTVKVKLHRAGPIRIFTYTEQTFTEGPNKGQRSESVEAYIYKVVDDKFIEVWGVLGDGDYTLRHLRWTRQKEAG